MKQHNHISKASTQCMKTYYKCSLWLKVQLGSFMVDYPYHILVCQEYEVKPSNLKQ